MASFKVDTSMWPIVVHEVEGTLTDALLDAYVLEATAVFLRSGKHVTILDISQMGSASAYARSRSSAWFREQRANLETSCLGLAYVIPSPLLRFITMTVLLVISLPTPYVVVQNRAEAVAWARKRLAVNDEQPAT